ncbi:MAG TPA: hypothetical protein VFG76_05295 [Candidatus Polarisedimenticolia bacterium]|nr:hypothetical protein [Candidatus Polarisedimenticolia bacterium]
MSGMTTDGARGRALAALIAAATATSVFGAAHVRLANVGSPGPLYECDSAACAPAQTDDPSRANLGRMDFYVLPDGCVALESAVLRPDGPGVDVECGPPGGTTHYRCETGACLPLDPATGDDGASTRPIHLPADCGGRIHELIVVGARTDAPLAYVECDASSGPAGEM